jgi:hypothetical protein
LTGSFQADFQKANESASTRSEVSAVMFQRAGVGSEISPTKEVADVLARVKAFPAVAESHPTAYEVEVATYDTVPLPLPTPEEEELDRQDAAAQAVRPHSPGSCPRRAGDDRADEGPVGRRRHRSDARHGADQMTTPIATTPGT